MSYRAKLFSHTTLSGNWPFFQALKLCLGLGLPLVKLVLKVPAEDMTHASSSLRWP